MASFKIEICQEKKKKEKQSKNNPQINKSL